MANVYVRSGAGGAGTGADWANAYTTLAAALTAKAAGDTFWVSEDHAETAGSSKTLTSPGTTASPCHVYCVDHAGTVPPVSADLRTTATITTTGAFAITFGAGYAYVNGIIFNCGSGVVSTVLQIGTSTSHEWIFENCQLNKLGTTTNAGAITLTAGANIASKIILKNTTVKFGATGDGIGNQGSNLTWLNTVSAIQGATLPTILFQANSSRNGRVLLEGVDLSALASGKTLVDAAFAPISYVFKDCKLGSSVTITQVGGVSHSGAEVVATRCDSGGTNYRTEKYTYAGTQTVETTLIRTSGASDGTTGLSHKVVSTANSKWAFPFEALPIAIWNDTTASNVTVTIEGLQDPRTSTSLPNNDDIWFDVEYLGASGNPQGSFKSGTKADGLATGAALTASTQSWDSLVTARANSTAYSLGDVRKVATNTGRVFVCTTAGTSSGSEPGGYATAVDGGSVTDGTATFKAAVRFKQALTLSSPQPGQKGALYVYPKVAKASGTYYIDPLIALS